jgi:hypothetical protein
MVFKNTAIATNASAISKQKLQQEQMQMLPMQDLISAETHCKNSRWTSKHSYWLPILSDNRNETTSKNR